MHRPWFTPDSQTSLDLMTCSMTGIRQMRQLPWFLSYCVRVGYGRCMEACTHGRWDRAARSGEGGAIYALYAHRLLMHPRSAYTALPYQHPLRQHRGKSGGDIDQPHSITMPRLYSVLFVKSQSLPRWMWYTPTPSVIRAGNSSLDGLLRWKP